MTSYLALLRGINVGGRNVIRMADLRACFEAGGFSEVRTYIQSGNVLFESSEPPSSGLSARIEAMLADALGYQAAIALRSRQEMRRIIQQAPAGFGAAPTLQRYDVLYLIPPLTAAQAITDVPVRQGVDEVHGGDGVLYFSRLIARASQSQLSRIVSLPVYRNLTIRNWNTTIKLMELLEAG